MFWSRTDLLLLHNCSLAEACPFPWQFLLPWIFGRFGLTESSSFPMAFGAMLTVPTRQKSGVLKSEQRQKHLQDLSNVVSQNRILDNVICVHGQPDKSTGSTALLIDQTNRISQGDSTRTCLLPLDIIFNESYDMVSFFCVPG